MQRACERCGTPLAPDLRFCTSCGAPVAASAPGQAAPPQPPPPPAQAAPPPPPAPPVAAAAVRYGGFWRRVGARIVDGFALAFLYSALRAMTDTSTASNLLLLVGVAYFVGFWSTGATPGQRILGLRVVTAAGTPPSVGRSLVRYLAAILSALVIFLGLIWVAFDPKKQSWHDKIAGTFVVRT